jgi:uncharacterized protein YggE
LNLSEHQVVSERVTATQQVLEQDLTVPETRKLVAQLKIKFSSLDAEEQKTSYSGRMQAVTRQLKKTKIWKDSQKCARLDILLQELEGLIGV